MAGGYDGVDGEGADSVGGHFVVPEAGDESAGAIIGREKAAQQFGQEFCGVLEALAVAAHKRFQVEGDIAPDGFT